MANKTNVSKIGNVQRPINTTRNDFQEKNQYGQPQTISPIGRDPDASGTIGTTVDIVSRKKNQAINFYSAARPYTISDTEA